jgi:hypothetical protein
MLEFFKRPAVKIIISALSGLGILLVSWLYLNSYYVLGLEEGLFNHETLIKHVLLKTQPKKTKKFVFISTGKDLSMIDDTAGRGNITVSDRYKLFKFLQAINNGKSKPEFVLIDIQFYYPFNYTVNDSIKAVVKRDHLVGYLPDRSVDDSLQAEIKKLKNSAITVLLSDKEDKIDTPIYKVNYAIANYTSYGGGDVNKFRINYPELHSISMAALMHEKLDGAVYTSTRYNTYCNHRLCFNTVWPSYYFNPENIESGSDIEQYHIGDLLGIPGSEAAIQTIVAGKVVAIGNFEDDKHYTPAGELPGTIILVDVYLSLLNGAQYVSLLWLLFLFICFSFLSYIAIFGKLPKISLKLGVFTNMLYSYFSKYFSYLGALLLISLISVFVFDMNTSLFLPAFIFSAIDFIRQKKYLPKNL